jgi:transcriptional regulator of acetoin/glycerol metabolism
VLDDNLRVVAATPGAARVLGERVPTGTSASKLLCGEALNRPLAEAMAAGRPASACVPRPRGDGSERLIHVRAAPLGEGKERAGFLLLLDDEGEGDAEAPVEFHGMLTRDPAMKRMFRIIERAALSEANVLVRGETGAGKELVANAIHALSPRRRGPFRAINCAALPPSLLESELFGSSPRASLRGP